MTTQFDEITQIDHRYDDDLIDFLRSVGEKEGYSNYWVAYPLAFVSGEEMIFLPQLPYHEDFRYTSRDDRYSQYHSVVDNAERVAYITTNHPELDNYLRDGFSTNKIHWQEKKVGDYQVFYNLSRRIVPIELGLGADVP
jgi:hypothetical protein